MPTNRPSSSSSRPRKSSSRNNINPNNNNNDDDDEILAQELQDQYRQEFLQRQARRSARKKYRDVPMMATAPEDVEITLNAENPRPIPVVHSSAALAPTTMRTASSSRMNSATTTVDEDEAFARQLQAELDGYAVDTPVVATPAAATVIPGVPVDLDDLDNEDARIAQQLQDEELARRYARRSSRRSTTSRTNTAPPSRMSSSSESYITTPPSVFMDERERSLPHDDDAMAARRISQEMDDAEMAQRLTLYEQEAVARRLQQEQAVTSTRRRTKTQLFLNRLLPLLICGGAIAVAMLFLLGVFDTDNIPFINDILPGSDDFVDLDPFAGNQTAPDDRPPTGSMRWPRNNNKGGLELQLLNALSDRWQQTFQTAVHNWDQGAPLDSLTLSTVRVDYETECEPVTGYMKVCNFDYGATRWRGLNEVLLNRRTNIIISSAAKMNEYYLSRESQEQRLYTMCHELGHGFGLPHWDEDFFNADLGNCMDYTNNPQANMLPDATNFMYLADLYGGRNVTSGAIVSQEAQTTGNGGKEKKSKKEGNRQLRGQDDDEEDEEEYDDEDDWQQEQDETTTTIMEEEEEDTNNVWYPQGMPSSLLLPDEEMIDSSRRRRRILHATDEFEVHWQVVNDDYGILTQYLLASSE